ncbi:MAG: histidine phosphatase family protein, partial [Paracoccaceae bacterium]
REFDFGAWDGMRFDDVAKRDPELSRAFWEAPGDVAAPNGESWNDVSARVSACVDSLHQRHTGRDIVIVAHIGVIMTQLQIASDMTASEVLAHRIDNLSVTRLDFADGRWSVAAINHQP